MSAVKPQRSALASERARAARARLAACDFCAHNCRVNRLAGDLGVCRAGAAPRCFSTQLEVADELELIPAFAIAFSGCDLRCDFCITGRSSWNPRAGVDFDAHSLALQAQRALQHGARTVMLLGGEPTIHLAAALELVAALPPTAKLVWKTNAHGSAAARNLLDGLFDVWLADLKFGTEGCALRLAGVRDSIPVAHDNLRWAATHSELIVRHLLMPGHLDCCWRPIAQWIAEELPAVKTSLRTAFWPAWRSARHLELTRPPTSEESRRALQLALDLGLNLVE